MLAMRLSSHVLRGGYLRAHVDTPDVHIEMTRVKNCFGIRAKRRRAAGNACETEIIEENIPLDADGAATHNKSGVEIGVADRRTVDAALFPDHIETAITVLRTWLQKSDDLESDSLAIQRMIFKDVNESTETFYDCAEDDTFERDINTCSLDALRAVDGIGEVLAERITGCRPYDSWNQVAALRQIGPIRLASLKRCFTLSPLNYCGCVTYGISAGVDQVEGMSSGCTTAPWTYNFTISKTVQRMIAIWMVILRCATSHGNFAVCCNRDRSMCEPWMQREELCLRRVANRESRDCEVCVKVRFLDEKYRHPQDALFDFDYFDDDAEDERERSPRRNYDTAARYRERTAAGLSAEEYYNQNPRPQDCHNDSYVKDDFPKSEYPANDAQTAERRGGDEQLSVKLLGYYAEGVFTKCVQTWPLPCCLSSPAEYVVGTQIKVIRLEVLPEHPEGVVRESVHCIVQGLSLKRDRAPSTEISLLEKVGEIGGTRSQGTIKNVLEMWYATICDCRYSNVRYPHGSELLLYAGGKLPLALVSNVGGKLLLLLTLHVLELPSKKFLERFGLEQNYIVQGLSLKIDKAPGTRISLLDSVGENGGTGSQETIKNVLEMWHATINVRCPHGSESLLNVDGATINLHETGSCTITF
jgi:hypothetical protein